MNKNSIMKKIFVLLLCCILALPLFGCQSEQSGIRKENAVQMQVISARTSIAQNFSFPTNISYFKSNGASDEILESYLAQLADEIRKQVWNKIFLNYFALYVSNPNNLYVIGGSQFKITEISYNSYDETLEFSLIFNSYDAWNYYHSSTKDEENEDDGNLFLDIDISQSLFPFCQQANGISIGENYYNLILSVQENYFSEDILGKLEKPKFQYDYATYHKRIHSNADLKFYDGLYHHVWIATYDQLASEKNIELKTVNAERGWWYLVVLCSVIALVTVGSVGIFVYDKIKKNKSKNKKES